MEVCEHGAVGLGCQGTSRLPTVVPPRPSLLEGYGLEVDRDHFDNMLTFNLKDGKQWRKRIYPRFGYPNKLLRWATAEEILSYLISFDSHGRWITHQIPQQPPSGTIFFYDRSKTKGYRNDGYDWKKRKANSSCVREDRMKLKVGQYQLLYGCYAHSSSNPDLHRRTYWLINNPNIIMVHYLEVTSSNHVLRKSVEEQEGLELADTPSDWSMLTVSDCNLCSLIHMVDSDTTTEIVLSQLSLILNNNLEQASTLEETLVSNNDGLPFDMYLDTRSKKTSSSKVDTSSITELQNTSKSSIPTNMELPTSNPINPKEDSLYKAPHFLVCQAQNGAMSCFVTIPPPIDSSAASMFPPGAKLPLPSFKQSLQMDLKTPQKSKKSKNGKEKAVDTRKKFSGSKVFGVLSRMKKQAVNGNLVASTSTGMSQSSILKMSDYDPDKFSDFAHRLSTERVTPDLERQMSLSSVSSDVDELNMSNFAGHSNTMSLNNSEDLLNIQQDAPIPAHSLANITMSLASQQTTVQQTSAMTDLHNYSGESDIELDDESVQQLLQLSPDPMQSDNLLNGSSHIEPPMSPLTQLMNSLASPSGEPITHHISSTFQTGADSSTSSSHMWSNSTTTPMPEHHQSSSSMNLPMNVDMNTHTSFQPLPHLSAPNPHTYSFNVPNSSITSNMIDETFQQPENHLLTDILSNQSSFHSGSLYSLPNASSEASSFSQFPGSFAPAQEYQDLESLMNTVITSNDAEAHPQVLISDNSSVGALINSTLHVQQACQSAGANTYSLATNSADSPSFSNTSSDLSSQYRGQSHHLSLPDLTFQEHDLNIDDAAAWSQFLADHAQTSTQSTSARSSSCLSNMSALQDIPEGSQMNLEELPSMHQLDVYDYRTGVSSIPSSPGQTSASSHSSLSAHDMFDTGSPSVLELCEMLSESPNVQQYDFSHLTLTDSEQHQLFHAAKTIQSAFRKYKDRRQVRSRQKRAALMIEKYYKQYREAKEQQDHAARKIQQRYRHYRRSRDLKRAVLFVQQMYRYHRNKKGNYPPNTT